MPRGLIYDRNNKLLVYNQPTYDLMITVKEVNLQKRRGTPIDTAQLCRLLNISKSDFDNRLTHIKDRRKNPGYSPLTPQRFITQLSPEEYAVLQEHLRKFPGFSIQSRTLRNYSYPCGAHILGSIGEVSQSTIDNDPTYRMGDYAGTDGLERSYEKELRGVNGVEILLRDARGRIQGSYKDGASDYEPIAGTDIQTTLDIDLQMIAEDLLHGKIGSVVAIEPATGEVLALASSPTCTLAPRRPLALKILPYAAKRPEQASAQPRHAGCLLAGVDVQDITGTCCLAGGRNNRAVAVCLQRTQLKTYSLYSPPRQPCYS